MLFHVTITHGQEDCPGRRPEGLPELTGPATRLEAVSAELSVTAHTVVWGASCILWAEPEHVTYALLEAPSLDAVERYVDALTPTGWAMRALPVFALPSQLAAVRQLLTAPASPFVFVQEPAPVSEPANDPDTADTLKGLTSEEPLDKRVTRAIPQPVVAPPVAAESVAAQPVAPPDRAPIPDSSAVTRFVDRPAVLEALGGSIPAPDPPAAAAPNEPYSPSDSPTVILEAGVQRPVGMRLVANTGPAAGTVFDIGETGATLGRLPENSIYLTDGRLSRHHARIEFRDDGYWLSDLGSQNGTLVNDHPLSEAHRLQAGDSIELGTTRLTVMDPDD